jgi:hypothetical protein
MFTLVLGLALVGAEEPLDHNLPDGRSLDAEFDAEMSEQRALSLTGASQGCIDCCTNHNCRAAFNGMPGMCCSSQWIYCCPTGASCVRCANSFRCTNAATVRHAPLS